MQTEKIFKIIKYAKYLPKIIFLIKNWPDFLLHYLGFKKGGAEYLFRNGIKIKTKDAISSATVSVIFIKNDYGSVSDNSIIIDIGANIGVFSIFAAQSENTIIYAFEPMADNFDLLKKNIRQNKLENRIFPFNFGLAGKEENRKLYLGESPFHSFLSASDSPFNALYGKPPESQKYSEITCITLKDVFDRNNIKKCGLLKIDCEGAEFEILYNLPDEYFKRIKEIRMEYHNHKNNEKNTGDSLRKFLEQKGFVVTKQKISSPHQGDLWAKNKF